MIKMRGTLTVNSLNRQFERMDRAIRREQGELEQEERELEEATVKHTIE
jgi:hypothetical protein